MRLLTTLTFLLISSLSYGQGIWNQVNGNSKFWRLKADSVLIVPRDTSATNNAFYLGAPVGDSARLGYYHGRFWGRDSTKFRGFAFVDDIPDVSGFVPVNTFNDTIAAQTLQRAAEKGNEITIPITTSRISSIGFIPSNITQGAIDINRTIDDGGFTNARGFRDNTIYKRGSSTPEVWYNNDRYAYAAFDAVGKLQGAYFNHLAGFQSRPDVDITGEVSYVYGVITRPNITAGTADSVLGVQIGDPTNSFLSGTVRNYFALYIDSAVAGNTKNYSIYSGSGVNYFGGNLGIGIGSQAPSEALDVYGNANIRGGLNLMGGSTNSLLMSAVGVNPPQFTTRSNGTKVVLYPNLSASSTDHAIGVESQHIWLSVPENINARGVKIYGGATQVARVSGTGMAYFGGSANATSTLQTAGSFAAPAVTVTGNTTLTDSHHTVLVNNIGTVTITLPAASGCPGRIYVIKKISSSPNDIIVSGASVTLTIQESAVIVQSNGTAWFIVGSYAAATVL